MKSLMATVALVLALAVGASDAQACGGYGAANFGYGGGGYGGGGYGGMNFGYGGFNAFAVPVCTPAYSNFAYGAGFNSYGFNQFNHGYGFNQFKSRGRFVRDAFGNLRRVY